MLLIVCFSWPMNVGAQFKTNDIDNCIDWGVVTARNTIFDIVADRCTECHSQSADAAADGEPFARHPVTPYLNDVGDLLLNRFVIRDVFCEDDTCTTLRLNSKQMPLMPPSMSEPGLSPERFAYMKEWMTHPVPDLSSSGVEQLKQDFLNDSTSAGGLARVVMEENCIGCHYVGSGNPPSQSLHFDTDEIGTLSGEADWDKILGVGPNAFMKCFDLDATTECQMGSIDAVLGFLSGTASEKENKRLAIFDFFDAYNTAQGADSQYLEFEQNIQGSEMPWITINGVHLLNSGSKILVRYSMQDSDSTKAKPTEAAFWITKVKMDFNDKNFDNYTYDSTSASSPSVALLKGCAPETPANMEDSIVKDVSAISLETDSTTGLISGQQYFVFGCAFDKQNVYCAWSDAIVPP